MLLAAAVCAVVLFTAGRTMGARQAVLDRLDSVEARTITITFQAGSGVAPNVAARLSDVDQVTSLFAMSAPIDVRNAELPDSTPVSARYVWPSVQPPDQAVASQPTLRILQMSGNDGLVALSSGEKLPIRSGVLPQALSAFQPVALISPPKQGNPLLVSAIVIVANRATSVPALTSAIGSMLDVPDPSKLEIRTSADLVAIGQSLSDQLGGFGRGLVLAMFGLMTVLTASVLFAVVSMQRKDLSRRRALGATRSYIVGLICGQTVLTGGVGALVATAVSLVALSLDRAPLPPPDFSIAVLFLAVFSALIGSVPPALLAAYREPVRDLRVP